MGRMQRNKGNHAERELLAYLRDELGDATLRRNLAQTREGGCDLEGLVIADWAIEVKRQEVRSLGVWWKQTERQAQKTGKRPALAYRASYAPWRIHIEMSLEEFCQFVREAQPIACAGLATGAPFGEPHEKQESEEARKET